MNQQPYNPSESNPHFHIGDTVKIKTDTRLMHVIAYKQKSSDKNELINDEVLCSWEDEDGNVEQHYFNESDLYLVEGTDQNIH
jgi:uncharacterized protein YodC (DUF2158 family)